MWGGMITMWGVVITAYNYLLFWNFKLFTCINESRDVDGLLDTRYFLQDTQHNIVYNYIGDRIAGYFRMVDIFRIVEHRMKIK